VARLSLNIFQISLLVVAGSALFLSTIVISYQQVPPTNQTTQGAQPTVKITSPKSGESAPTTGNLTVMGKSSDTETSSCQVSVIVNDVKPYQTAVATGSGGVNDYSQWKFTITPNYTAIKEGQNKITSKVTCPGGGGVGLTKWFGINVTGTTGAAAVNTNSTSAAVTGTGSQTSNASNQLSGPLYSYSQKQAENKKASESGPAQDNTAKKDLAQAQNEQSQSTVTIAPPNNRTGSSTGFVPPFSP
jgi:hypothetical protein